MTSLEILPFILFIVVIATAIAEYINVPYPLILVIAGIMVGFMPGIPSWHPPSNLVLPVFLPPILFAAARTISWQDIRGNLNNIISLSAILVLINTFAIAGVIYWIIPKINFAGALVLGAIISPTDAVASTSILSKMHVRQSIIRTLEVESLFNDAAGIVLYKMAVLFVFMGSLNTHQLGISSILVGGGGIIIGLLFSYFTNLIVEQFLSHSENNLPIIMSLILAYVAYLFAERLGASGVLAVVAAGLYHKKTEKSIAPNIRLAESSTWDSLIFFLNGIIFITIGIQFPEYLKKVNYIPTTDLVLFSVITIAALISLRFFWITLTSAVNDLYFHFFKKNIERTQDLNWPRIFIISWSGMRGLVSLALAVALPITLSDGVAFPFRNLIIFLTIIVILFTLVVQGLGLPKLVKWLAVAKDDDQELKLIEKTYRQLTKQAISAMQEVAVKEKSYSETAIKLVEKYYANRLLQFSINVEGAETAHSIRLEARQLLKEILQFERKELDNRRAAGELSEEIYIKILRKIDRDEVGFASYQ